ncbi:RNA 2',3'-cyclic phosphodiesterase [Palleronia abyssalis]|uniref:RNA 2',3'-cyclic phosphodiesterase n=1 Tax=Palleronia abyssalis TaxID=1501240 RepID=A0A2R8BVX0_9RHOB|nr:RNA 2',3'-cyclic phosphodiesterase [Palleronia abyssalis]SPJ24275.1 RNA 2',3'-cyclic phosphodiesterase [Palleronia abyssalis]
MRAFLALDPPDPLRNALSALQDDLRCGRHVDEDDLHLTLCFFPDASQAALEEMDLTLDLMRPGPVTIEVAGIDTFGSENPRSVHASVMASAPLVHLQKKVETAARRSGIDLPHRRFVPHITLARFPNRMPPEDHVRLGRFLERRGNVHFDAAVIQEVVLYQSTLTEDGPRYDELERYPLI